VSGSYTENGREGVAVCSCLVFVPVRAIVGNVRIVLMVGGGGGLQWTEMDRNCINVPVLV
jgi:hypothetical protein